jgi:6-phosphogluconolactonase
MKNFLAIMVLSCLTVISCGQKDKNQNSYLFISPYSRGSNQYVAVYTFNSSTGEALFKSKVEGITNPSYLVISPDGRNLYSVNEGKEGNLSSFSFDRSTGEIKHINSVPSGGAGPTYITIDKLGKYVYCANYNSGSVGVVAVNKDGSLGDVVQVFPHEAKPGGTGRQQGPHAHAVVFNPDGSYLLSPDLGSDKVYIYRFDGAKDSNPLEPADPPYAAVKDGSGPRHVAFHPNGRYAYVIHEMAGIISAWDFSNGKMTEKQNITMLAEGFTGRIGGGDNHVSPDGRFLYASNRGDANEIIIYEINKDGSLVFTGRQSTLGVHPRNFVIDPTGNFLLVGNNQSNYVTIFRIEKKSGLLTPLDTKIEIGEPGCLKFL